MQLLQKKAVLFLTAGFDEYFVFQNVFSFIQDSKDLPEAKILKAVLTDGDIYISGIYLIKNKSQKQIENCLTMRQFDIVKIRATYVGCSKPILINSLQIQSSNHKGLYGKIPVSIQDYLMSKMAYNALVPSPNAQIVFSENEKAIIQNSNQVNLQNKHNIQKKIAANPFQNSLDQLFKDNSQQKQYQLIQDIQFVQKPINNKRLKQNQSQQIYEEIQIFKNPSRRIKKNHDFQLNPEEKEKQFQIQQRPTQASPPFQRQYEQDKDKIKSQVNPFINDQNQKILATQQSGMTQIINKENMKVIQIDVIDLDNMSTQKEQMVYYRNSNKKQFRKSNRKSLQSIFQSEQKQSIQQVQVQDQKTVPHRFSCMYQKNIAMEIQDQATRPRSQNMQQPSLITPIKPNNIQSVQLFPLNKSRMGSTTERKMIKDQYNLLIQNLYQDNCSFKILCRVNYLYQWKSKIGKACMGLQLMDLNGQQIKAVIYMNHSSKECKKCADIIEVGKVYSFQNGQCKRAEDEKNDLELIFNLRSKSYNVCLNSGPEQCTGKGKITIASKISIPPINKNRILSIQNAVQQYDNGKKYLFNVYGIFQSLRVSEYEKKIQAINNIESDENSVQIVFPQDIKTQTQKQLIKSNKIQKNNEGFKRIYLNGYLVEPASKKKIAFGLVVRKSTNQTEIQTDSFLEKNNIKNGAAVILHHMKINSSNDNTVKKLQKTKRSYVQIVTSSQPSKINIRSQFAAEIICISSQNRQAYEELFQLFSYDQTQIKQIIGNPRFINYSEQPYTLRKIFQMNRILENHILLDQCCHSFLNDVRIHYIQQKPSIYMCEFCKKKIAIQNNTSKNLKYCTKCKKIVKTTRLFIFSLIFSDNTASFPVQVLKESIIESFLQIPLSRLQNCNEQQKMEFLEKIKYNQFSIKVKSQNKMGGPIHRIISILRTSINAKIDQIKQQRKGEPKFLKRLQSSW